MKVFSGSPWKRAAMALPWALVASCGGGRAPVQGSFLLLEAGKRTSIVVPVPDGISVDDSVTTAQPGGSLRLELPEGGACVSAILVLCSDGDAAGRLSDLIASDSVVGAETESIQPRGDPLSGYDVVMYSARESCFVERLWPRGSGEALILRACGAGDTPRALLGSVQDLLSGASVSQWAGLRRVRLSDRGAEQIRAGLEQQDVTLPPRVTHVLDIGIDPGEMTLSVSDSLTVDFSSTPGLQGASFILPRVDAEATEEITAVEGTCYRAADSLLCAPDSASRVFRGVYSSTYDGFYVERKGFVHGQVRLSSSFCCGEWFYPGSALPSSYSVRASVPEGTVFYCPLVLTGTSQSSGRSVFSFVSPEGGMASPLPWAAADFSESLAAGGRCRVLYGSDIDAESADSSLKWADRLGTALWDKLGFQGSNLDFVLLKSIGAPVFSWGPGCVMTSPDILCSLEGHPAWAESLSSGEEPGAPLVVARAARAMLLLSTYLPDGAADALSAYSIYVFEQRWGTAGSADSLLEAFRLYYLSSAEADGGDERSMADPQLTGTSLSGPVLLGKAPMVFAMFSKALPGFDAGLSRALGGLRHSGYAYGRIASAAGLEGSDADFYWSWLYLPGVPQICVTWSDSAGTVFLKIEQLQPGREFPMPDGQILIRYSGGSSSTARLSGPDRNGVYRAPALQTRIGSIQLWPDFVLPADIVYERQGSKVL